MLITWPEGNVWRNTTEQVANVLSAPQNRTSFNWYYFRPWLKNKKTRLATFSHVVFFTLHRGSLWAGWWIMWCSWCPFKKAYYLFLKERPHFFPNLPLSVYSARGVFNCRSFVIWLFSSIHLSERQQGQSWSFPNPLFSVCIIVGMATRQSSNKGGWKRVSHPQPQTNVKINLKK